ncbi:zeta toxin family protein [Marinactinospora rubrisoli]|uniref:UDP-N-acetylglucosamine kinase n=1 Tax=Marinactinospora rubrisoli TaxID=2715399 RepID=A0ABW2KD76_9ACTN
MARPAASTESLDDIDPLDFALSERELKHIFRTEVIPRLFEGRQTFAGAPVLILGGVPGSGKSTLFAVLQRSHPYDFVVLDRDWFRQFQTHPAAKEWIARDPLAMPYVTEDVAGKLLKMAADHAIAHGYPLVVENSLRTDYPLKLVDKAAEAGRPVHLATMAVPPWRSRLDALTRFLLPGVPAARWTQHDSHEKCIPEVPKTLAKLERHPNVRRIDLSDRARFRYRNTRGPDGEWRADARAVEVYQATVAREPTPEEAPDWLRQYWANVALAVDRDKLSATTRPRFALLHADADHLARYAYRGEQESRDLRRHRAAQQVLRHILDASEQGVPGKLLPASPLMFLCGDADLAGMLAGPAHAPALLDAAIPYLRREQVRRTQIPPEQAEVERRVREESRSHLRTSVRGGPGLARVDFPRPVSPAGTSPATSQAARRARRRELLGNVAKDRLTVRGGATRAG